DLGLYGAASSALERAGAPVVDQFRMTPGVASPEASGAYRTLLTTLPQGLSFVALHCNVSGDIEAIVPSRAHWRIDEHRLVFCGEPQRWMAEEGIGRVGYRALRDCYRRAALK